MDAHVFTGAQSIGEICYEAAKVSDIGWNVDVGNWVGEELQSDLLCDFTLLGQTKQSGLIAF